VSNRVSQSQIEVIVRRMVRAERSVTTALVRDAVFGPEQGFDVASYEAVYGTLWAMRVRGELVDDDVAGHFRQGRRGA